MSEVAERLRQNGGQLALAAAAEIEALQERVRELSFALVLALANLDGDAAVSVADALKKYGNTTQEG